MARKITGVSDQRHDRLRMGDESLRGRTIVVTRPRPQAERFAAELRELGARAIEFPVIEIREPEDPAPLRAAVDALETYDWIVFTSVNGVKSVQSVLASGGRSFTALGPVRVGVIGPATAAEVSARLGVEPDVMPQSYRAEALVDALADAIPEMNGLRLLLPRAAEARAVLPERLRTAGVRVEEVTAYRTVPPEADGEPLARMIRAGEVDWVTFTASSTVRNFVELVGDVVRPARVAAIGPITADTARDFGLPVDVTAREYTIAGLIRALARAASGGESHGGETRRRSSGPRSEREARG